MNLNRNRAEAVTDRILSNAAGIQYGAVSVTANIHDGRIVSVVYSTTENTREAETGFRQERRDK